MTFLCDWALSGGDSLSLDVKGVIISSFSWAALTYAYLIAVNNTLERKRLWLIVSSWLFCLVVIILTVLMSGKLTIDIVRTFYIPGIAFGLILGFMLFGMANKKRLQMDLTMSVALVVAIILIGGIYWETENKNPQLLVICISLMLSVFSVLFTGVETRRKNIKARLDSYERRFYHTLSAVQQLLDGKKGDIDKASKIIVKKKLGRKQEEPIDEIFMQVARQLLLLNEYGAKSKADSSSLFEGNQDSFKELASWEELFYHKQFSRAFDEKTRIVAKYVLENSCALGDVEKRLIKSFFLSL